MSGTERPIGYWLKHLHNLIDQRFDATAAERVGETRRLLMRGLTPEEYAETVRILAVMAGHLEAASEVRAPSSRPG
ncbi:hypothetical protein [Micromonospora mirobrigensis]|uniref:Uncharacterized protein n=1 Tax=Micromonospora mirobrigensis TaxID=262898 RepID=A0A1C4UDA5_9ACTN|nr:hypothetical protein [Micromonospora mirobrigensis]SCE69663.1 hypothetical protein GA0070564_101397 [Micromonospora mirobrigensis]